jgi:hypothetical protein
VGSRVRRSGGWLAGPRHVTPFGACGWLALLAFLHRSLPVRLLVRLGVLGRGAGRGGGRRPVQGVLHDAWVMGLLLARGPRLAGPVVWCSAQATLSRMSKPSTLYPDGSRTFASGVPAVGSPQDGG